jgi:hypothetical protein
MKALLSILIATVCVSPLIAQDNTRVIVDSALTPATGSYRDPHLAVILGSLIPGAGHLYAGEYLRGAENYAGTLGVIGMGAIVFSLDNCGLDFLSECKPRSNFINRIVGGVGIGAGILTWISSARDAGRAAERTNEGHHRKAAHAKPIIEAPAGSHEKWRAGVTIPW